MIELDDGGVSEGGTVTPHDGGGDVDVAFVAHGELQICLLNIDADEFTNWIVRWRRDGIAACHCQCSQAQGGGCEVAGEAHVGVLAWVM